MVGATDSSTDGWSKLPEFDWLTCGRAAGSNEELAAWKKWKHLRRGIDSLDLTFG